MHCRILHSTPGLYPLDAIAKCLLEGKISPGENHWMGRGGAGRKQPTPQCVLEEELAGPADELAMKGEREETSKTCIITKNKILKNLAIFTPFTKLPSLLQLLSFHRWSR